LGKDKMKKKILATVLVTFLVVITTVPNIYALYSINRDYDNNYPEVLIPIPARGGTYIFNTRLYWGHTFSFCLVIGKIGIVAQVEYVDFNITRVEFYIDDTLAYTDTEPGYTEPGRSVYFYDWTKISFSMHTVKAIAYDEIGNSDSDEIKVLKLF
jgi:hypothetical protein